MSDKNTLSDLKELADIAKKHFESKNRRDEFVKKFLKTHKVKIINKIKQIAQEPSTDSPHIDMFKVLEHLPEMDFLYSVNRKMLWNALCAELGIERTTRIRWTTTICLTDFIRCYEVKTNDESMIDSVVMTRHEELCHVHGLEYKPEEDPAIPPMDTEDDF
jgi:hypothetical protein